MPTLSKMVALGIALTGVPGNEGSWSPGQDHQTASPRALLPERQRLQELRHLVDDARYTEAERSARAYLMELEPSGRGAEQIATETRMLLSVALRRSGGARDEETLRLAIEGVAGAATGTALQGEALLERATLRMMRGEAEEALADLRGAVTVLEPLGPSPELALALLRIANLHQGLSRDMDRADEFYERSDEVLARLEPSDEARAVEGWWQHGRAILAETRGDYLAALEGQERALAARRATFRPDHPLVLESQRNVARALGLVGSYSEARDALEEVLRLSPEDPETLRSLASLYEWLGADERAAELLQRAQRGEQSPSSLLQTARHHASNGRPLEALELYARFFESCQDEQLRAFGRITEGGLLETLGRLDEAERDYLEARAILEELPVEDSWVWLLVNESSLDLARGDPARAAEGAREAVALRDAQGLSDLGANLDPLLTLARAEQALGNPEEAFGALRRAEAISRRFLVETIDRIESPLAWRFFGRAHDVLRTALSILLESSELGPERVAWAFDTVVRRRALVLQELAAREARAREGSDPELSELAQELKQVRRRVANLLLTSEPDRGLGARIAALRGERDRLESELAAAGCALSPEVGLTEIREHLAADRALVSYLEVALEGRNPEYLAFVIRGEEEPQLVRLGPADSIDALVEEWRNDLLHLDRAAETRQRRIGSELRARIWDPVAERLEGTADVFIVPDGALHLVSFAALPGTEDGFLVEGTPSMRFLTAERDLVPHGERPSGRGLLAVGAPGLTNAAQEAREVAQAWLEQDRPDAEVVEFLVGDLATESAFERAAPGKRMVHVAAHRFALGESRPPRLLAALRDIEVRPKRPAESGRDPASRQEDMAMSRLGLHLAPGSAEVEGDDGFLSAAELSSMDLDGVDCVVLAACSSGLGEIGAGEGVLGLQRALRLAGARTTVTSLWAVEDAATRAWMRAFYSAHLELGLDVPGAVVHAAREVLKERRDRHESTHPFYWAAFVATDG